MNDISVIIPVFNAERHLAAAIESVLSQEICPREIIVIDDGSTDGSVSVAQRYDKKIRLHRQANAGASAARNSGVAMARGSLLAFLDADDLWMPGKLTLQTQALRNDPELDLVLGKVTQFICPTIEGEKHRTLRADLTTMPAYLIGAMLIRREAFIRVGPLNQNLQLGEFIDWFDRAKTMGLRYQILEEVVLRRRIHDNNQGIHKRAHLKDYLSVVKAALDRKRAMDSRSRSSNDPSRCPDKG